MILKRFLEIINLLSLDVVAGAMICHSAFLRLPEGKFTHATTSTWLLGIAVFIIYTLDRQLDNLKPGQIATPRHRFHKQYAKVLKLSVALAMLLGIYLLGHITYLTLMVGFGIAFITSIYLVVVSKLSSDSIFQAYKEPVTAFVYASGVCGTAIVQHSRVFSWIDWALAGVFFVIAFQNLLLFSAFEQQKYPQVHSLGSMWGARACRQILYGLFVINLIATSFILWHSTYSYSMGLGIVEIIMSTVLVLITYFESFFVKNDRYRWVGDGIFLIPLFLFILIR